MKSMVRSCGVAASLVACFFLMGCAGTSNKQSTGEYIDSKTITAKVKSALIADPAVSAMDVHVNTFKGVVELNGFVDTPEQKKRAEDLAWGVEGVKAVKNDLTIKSTASKASANESANQANTENNPHPNK